MGKLADILAARLIEVRGEMSQLEFAKRIGISKSSLNRMEIGEQNVTLATLENLCAHLKCDVIELLSDKGPVARKTHRRTERFRK